MWYHQWIKTASAKGEVYHHPLSIPMSDTLRRIFQALAQNGMRGLIVGGAVRDQFLGLSSKDIDVEVYGGTYEALANLLRQFGRTDLVGKSFGVIKVVDSEGNDYDFSIPRRDSKMGTGHKDFQATFDPSITPKEAASRRDFSWNALAYDPLNETVHDYFGGRNDIANKTMRHTSEAFGEDPLRVLRGMQFAARFGHTIHPETAVLAQQLRDQIIGHTAGLTERNLREMQHPTHEWHPKGVLETDPATGKITPRAALSWHLPRERLEAEWMKWATKGKKPSAILPYLHATGWDTFFPEIANLKGVPQEPEWHPEGSVDKHTGHVLDAMAKICDREGITGDERAVRMFAALGHDFAKAHTTVQMEKDGKLRWTAHGHEKAGGPLVEQFLRGIGAKPEIIQQVVPLVENHLMHIVFNQNGVRPAVVKKLARRLHPANVEQLADVIESDMSGRPPLPGGMPPEAIRMVEMAKQHQVIHEPEKPWIMGRHLIDRGYQPGPWFGALLKEAAAAQENGDIPTQAHAPAWLDQRLAQEPPPAQDVNTRV